MPSPRTTKGKNTRNRLLETATMLFHRKSVNGVSIDEVLMASKTGKGQFYHYFANKEHLVREVLKGQIQIFIGDQEQVLDNLDSLSDLAEWFASIRAWHENQNRWDGCPIGCMAAELDPQDDDLCNLLRAAFDGWEQPIAQCFRRMQRRGELSGHADPERLAGFVVAANQGGMLMTKARRSGEPLHNAHLSILDYLKGLGTQPFGQ